MPISHQSKIWVLSDRIQGLWQSSRHTAYLMSPSMYLKTVLTYGSFFCHYRKFSVTSSEHGIWGDLSVFLNHGHSYLAPNKPCLLFLWGENCFVNTSSPNMRHLVQTLKNLKLRCQWKYREQKTVLTQTKGTQANHTPHWHTWLEVFSCVLLAKGLGEHSSCRLGLPIFFHKGLAVKYLGFPGYLISVRIVHLCH